MLTDRDWTHPQGGGTGTNLYGQVERWLAWGHRVSVIACGYDGCLRHERHGALEIHRVGGRSTVFPRAIWKQWRGLVPDADVVLEVVNGISFLTPIWLRTPRVTLVHHVHRDHYVREWGRKGALAAFLLETVPLRFLYRGSRFLTISQAAALDLEALGVPRESIAMNYIGVDLAAYSPGGERAPEPTLLYLGRFKRYKRIEVLLDVLEHVPEARLEMAGDGDHREAIEAEIEARGLGERVRLHGHVSEERKLELLRSSWVNLTASSAEGWCLTVMEAAACGTPSAALAVGGLPESILDEETGLLALEPEELAEKTRLLVRDRELRERLGARALERAQEFTWDRTARDNLAVLESEVEAARDRPGLIEGLRQSDTGRAAGLAAAVITSNVIALAFTIVFARVLGAGGYGSLAALVSAFIILMVPGSALQIAAAREVSRAVASGDPRAGAGVKRWLTRLLAATVVVALAAIPLRHVLGAVINVDEVWAAAGVPLTAMLWMVLSVERGALQGFERYKMVGFSIIGESSTRLVFGLALVAAGLDVTGAFLGSALSIGTMALALAPSLMRRLPDRDPDGDEPRLRDLLGDAWVPVLGLTLLFALQEVHVIVVKHEATSGRRRLLRRGGRGGQGDHLGGGRARPLPAARGRPPGQAGRRRAAGAHAHARADRRSGDPDGADLRAGRRAAAPHGVRRGPDRGRRRAAMARPGDGPARLRLPVRPVPAGARTGELPLGARPRGARGGAAAAGDRSEPHRDRAGALGAAAGLRDRGARDVVPAGEHAAGQAGLLDGLAPPRTSRTGRYRG